MYSPQGALVALHRKVHLFDIDIPGKIRFQESEVLTPGSSLTSFETRARTLSIYRSSTETLFAKCCIAFGKIGLGICYDVRFPELAMLAGRQGRLPSATFHPTANSSLRRLRCNDLPW